MIARDAEVKRAFLQDDTIIRHKDSNHIILSYKASDTVIEKGIYMLGVVSTNYYHFHVEIISRLPFIDGKEEYRGWPILIDKGVLEIPQMKEFLSVMNVYNHPVIGIDNNTCVHVGKLAFVSRNMWMPFNMKKNIQMQPGDVLISSSVVDNIRERIFSRPIQQGREKKIFLSRANTKNSRLENTAEIENIFRDNGFAVIMTEKLSYEEQVALFHGADMIAGVTGAAFTNMIYCRPGTRIGIIAGVEQRLDFFIKVADLVGARCRIIPAKITYHDAMSISRDKFKLEADVAKQFINNI
ncbi:MAG: glycosyltransferase family 61 protein [Lachnospiraceae bacterium]